MAMKIANKLLGMLIGIILLAVILPIAIAFILATNVTGWNASLVTLYQYGFPAIIIVIAIVMILESIMSTSNSRKR